MQKNSTRENKFWADINKNQLSSENISANFDNFKSSPINHKIALFNPEVNGIRYLKTLIYNMASRLSEEQWKILRLTLNRELGNPISISYNNESVCLDYLQAAHELSFIGKHIDLHSADVVEIGAGYGRTCHTIISNAEINSYTIIDLENCMELSRKYLSAVLNQDQFNKISFVDNTDTDRFTSRNYDLAINIDSFAEMDADIVHSYLGFIDSNCTNFYTKNPVGKYYDASLDGHSQGKEVIELALKQGILTDIIDIDNNTAIADASNRFIEAYRPGNHWAEADNSWAEPFSYIWQAIYQRR